MEFSQWKKVTQKNRKKEIGISNVCFIKNRSKHSSNTLMSLQRFFMKQTLTFTKDLDIEMNSSKNCSEMKSKKYKSLQRMNI